MSMKRVFKSQLAGPLIAFLVIFIVATITTPRFFDFNNFSNQILQVAIISIMAIGSTLVIVTGGIDISPGAAMALQTMLIAVFIKDLKMSVPATLALILLIGLVMGVYNGVLVAYLRIPAFIATLASQNIFRGLSFMLNNGAPLQSLSGELEPIFYTKLLGKLPIVLFYILILYIIAYQFMKYAQVGRNIYAIGGNENAARLSGINVKHITVITFAIAGILTAAASFLMSCRLNSGSQNYGSGLEMSAIGAAVIGGASLSGGKGNVAATFIGAMTIVIVQNVLNLNSIPTAVQSIVTGAIIMIAVFIDMWKGDVGRLFSRKFSKQPAPEGK